jgi:hypothetical protein
MDIQNNLISTAISAGVYILYKMIQRYYFRSGCHNNTLEISIVDKEEKKEEKEITIEMTKV